MVEIYDVLVVGSGPAGATTAINLAKNGIKVALIDKETFPRGKSCGDGITADGLDVLGRVGLGAWAEEFPAFQGLRFSSPDHKLVNIPLETTPTEIVGRTIPRRLFDDTLVKYAETNGAVLIQGEKIEQVIIDPDSVTAKSKTHQFKGKLLVLAEGSHAPLSKSLGLVHDGPELMAARQYLTGDTGSDPYLEVHFQSSIIPGYNWMFPVGEGRINIGTGTFQHRIKDRMISLREELERFKSDPILRGRLEKTEPDGPIEGHPLRTQYGTAITHSSRTLLVGDTAGLVNPFTGVGIGPGMLSGELAAKTIQSVFETGDFHKNNLSQYSKALNKQFAADRKAAFQLRKYLSNPRRLNKLFSVLEHDHKMALLLGHIFFDKRSPRSAFRLEYFLKMM